MSRHTHHGRSGRGHAPSAVDEPPAYDFPRQPNRCSCPEQCETPPNTGHANFYRESLRALTSIGIHGPSDLEELISGRRPFDPMVQRFLSERRWDFEHNGWLPPSDGQDHIAGLRGRRREGNRERVGRIQRELGGYSGQRGSHRYGEQPMGSGGFGMDYDDDFDDGDYGIAGEEYKLGGGGQGMGGGGYGMGGVGGTYSGGGRFGGYGMSRGGGRGGRNGRAGTVGEIRNQAGQSLWEAIDSTRGISDEEIREGLRTGINPWAKYGYYD